MSQNFGAQALRNQSRQLRLASDLSAWLPTIARQPTPAEVDFERTNRNKTLKLNEVLSEQAWLSPSNVSCQVRSESGYTPAGWIVNGYISLIADEISRCCIVDHDAGKLQIAVGVVFKSMRKKAAGRLRIYQFWPKFLDLGRENL